MQAGLMPAHIALVRLWKGTLQGRPLRVDVVLCDTPDSRGIAPPFFADALAPDGHETAFVGKRQKDAPQHIGKQHTGIEYQNAWQAACGRRRRFKNNRHQEYRCSSSITVRVRRGRPNSSS